MKLDRRPDMAGGVVLVLVQAHLTSKLVEDSLLREE